MNSSQCGRERPRELRASPVRKQGVRIASSSLLEAGRFSSASWFRGGQAYREKGTGKTWKGCGSRRASAQIQLRQGGLCLCVEPGAALFRSTSFVCCVLFNLLPLAGRI